MAMQLTSSAFEEGQLIPAKYTCDGEDISPRLKWMGVPAEAVSLALIVEDPDAPSGTFDHWILFNLPPTEIELPEGVPATETLENGARQGQNGRGEVGYMGPCPPPETGTHRYFFKLYALDAELGKKAKATKAEVLSAMEGHILDEASLMGTYNRER
ncbi:MAG: YbhB/YbcL family Raf kinase inhibitor-like protein [Acidobacteriota bacterium]|nr:YbhB/YbcL family Raf kinase inhibitor-like protein [Acidobacteriota bacterium]